MQDTIAIALITSLSTLSAAALSGALALRQGQRQLAHEARRSHAEREADRADRRAELRREAYERFLRQVDAAYRVLDERWRAEQPENDENVAFASRRALDEARIRVKLVGPAEIGDHADRIAKGVLRESQVLGRLLTGEAGPVGEEAAIGRATTGTAAPAIERAATSRREALESRDALNAAFVAACRTALEGTP